MGIAEFIDRSNCAVSPTELFELLAKEAAQQGFEFAAYGALTYLHADEPRQRRPAVLLNYPDDWQQHYFAQQYQAVDPVVTMTPMLPKPFSWSALLSRAPVSAKQRRIFEEAKDAGLHGGLSVPLHGPWGRTAVMSFAASVPQEAERAQVQQLYLMAQQFHIVMADFTAAKEVELAHKLSLRERDCLGWSAQGKSSWDISTILGISENTVNFHLKNAMRKLGASSRVVAAIKAMRLGLIDLPDWK